MMPKSETYIYVAQFNNKTEVLHTKSTSHIQINVKTQDQLTLCINVSINDKLLASFRAAVPQGNICSPCKYID